VGAEDAVPEVEGFIRGVAAEYLPCVFLVTLPAPAPAYAPPRLPCGAVGHWWVAAV
jgi:hypothetical protein